MTKAAEEFRFVVWNVSAPEDSEVIMAIGPETAARRYAARRIDLITIADFSVQEKRAVLDVGVVRADASVAPHRFTVRCEMDSGMRTCP